VRGFDAAGVADRAIRLLCEAGVPVGVNLVLTRESFEHVGASAAHVASLGARELQLLRYKPAGRAASLDYLAKRLAPAQIDAFYPLLEALVAQHGDGLSVRIDCALVPYLSRHVSDARRLERWGIFGCEAGRHLAAVTRESSLVPCSFSSPHGAATVTVTAFDSVWDHDSALDAFRSYVASPPEPCASCSIARVCRGGCKIVSEHLEPREGGFAPDPECPRVVERALATSGEGSTRPR
jgi:radical SAM protein with 4Fe4S-binding SPASM domain